MSANQVPRRVRELLDSHGSGIPHMSSGSDWDVYVYPQQEPFRPFLTCKVVTLRYKGETYQECWSRGHPHDWPHDEPTRQSLRKLDIFGNLAPERESWLKRLLRAL